MAGHGGHSDHGHGNTARDVGYGCLGVLAAIVLLLIIALLWSEISNRNIGRLPSVPGRSGAPCLTTADANRLGDVIRSVYNDGKLSGWQIRFIQSFTADDRVDELHVDNRSVRSVSAGQTGTIWVTYRCRPAR